jgi:hypothetical protein
MPEKQRSSLELNRKILSEIAMRRTKNPHLCGLIVEGTSDRKFFEKFISHGVCTVIPVGGKDNVLETLQNADKNTLRGLVGIVDSDSDHFLGSTPSHRDVFQTDVTDVDSMVFASSSFVNLVRECVIREGDMRSSEAILTLAESVRNKIVAAAFPLGLIRCISARDSLGIKFVDLAYNTFINSLTCICNLDQCIISVLALSRNTAMNDLSLEQLLRAEIQNCAKVNPWNVVRGHDLSRIAALCSENLLQRNLSGLEIERSLRLGYDYERFRKTNVYARVSEWAERNIPFVVWAPAQVAQA